MGLSLWARPNIGGPQWPMFPAIKELIHSTRDRTHSSFFLTARQLVGVEQLAESARAAVMRALPRYKTSVYVVVLACIFDAFASLALHPYTILMSAPSLLSLRNHGAAKGAIWGS